MCIDYAGEWACSSCAKDRTLSSPHLVQIRKRPLYLSAAIAAERSGLCSDLCFYKADVDYAAVT